MNVINLNNKYFEKISGNIAENRLDTLFENLFSSHVPDSVNESSARSMKDRVIFVLDSIWQDIQNILNEIVGWVASRFVEIKGFVA